MTTIIATLILWIFNVWFCIRAIVISRDSTLGAGMFIMLFVELMTLIMFLINLSGIFGGGFIAYVFNVIILILQIMATLATLAIYYYRKFFD